MIVFIINNIFEIALALTIVILKIGWLVDKLKVKKELEKLEKKVRDIRHDFKGMSASLNVFFESQNFKLDCNDLKETRDHLNRIIEKRKNNE